MGPGIFLLVVGALLTFAVEDHVQNLNLAVAGVILMIAGGVLLVHARNAAQTEKTRIRRDESSDPGSASHVIEETIREKRRH